MEQTEEETEKKSSGEAFRDLPTCRCYFWQCLDRMLRNHYVWGHLWVPSSNSGNKELHLDTFHSELVPSSNPGTKDIRKLPFKKKASALD